ncbi:MAG: bifunctional 5,10-methylenetetrahydrofolate dehydrogenase/5,10-methenyltetrahydrofolate cyclohydrolase [Candidatus Falkowbacteria bacterium]|nr:bifunctional 5,10-methylenetetrahydrofolate dehydrogenase/5,10-methenyltetrahydrofolate cyclohydrolase [Candidatus Falkowbacteria bacterium]
MVKKIDGTAIAEKVKDVIAQNIFKLKGPRPNLAIVLVGERADSQLYVALKEREGKKVGVETHVYKLPVDISEEELFDVIGFLNKDASIDGILVQLPLPEKFNTDKVIAAIDPLKDVDGFHPLHPDYIISPVSAAILACLEDIKFSGAGKSACVLYNSEVFGQSIKDILEKKGLKVSLKDNPEKADLLVTALGEPHKIKKEMIKDGAVIIDIGITKQDGKVLGDVDFEDIKDKASYITPVPGGIGPMTIAFLFKNVWEIFQRRKNGNFS